MWPYTHTNTHNICELNPKRPTTSRGKGIISEKNIPCIHKHLYIADIKYIHTVKIQCSLGEIKLILYVSKTFVNLSECVCVCAVHVCYVMWFIITSLYARIIRVMYTSMYAMSMWCLYKNMMRINKYEEWKRKLE